MIKIEPGDICENCTKHPATEIWVGDGGYLAITRDYMQGKWCKCCTIKAQIQYAEAVYMRLSKLRKELETACASI